MHGVYFNIFENGGGKNLLGNLFYKKKGNEGLPYLISFVSFVFSDLCVRTADTVSLHYIVADSRTKCGFLGPRTYHMSRASERKQIQVRWYTDVAAFYSSQQMLSVPSRG